MPNRTVRVRGRATPVPALRPESFGDEPRGVAIPPGTAGLTKVTSRDSEGPGTYLGVRAPPTAESAARRLQLPAWNRAEEVRTYRTTDWLYANIGIVAESRTKDIQLEARNPEVLEEVSRRRLPFDFEARISHAFAGAAVGALAGFAAGSLGGNPWLGLLVGMAVGFLLGLIAPTDWGDLLSTFFGAADVQLLLALT